MTRLLHTLADCAAICLAAALLGIALSAWCLPEDAETIAAAARVRVAVGGAP